MATILEKEIERAVERRLTPGVSPGVAPGIAPAKREPEAVVRRRSQPVVRFSPLIAEPAPAQRRLRKLLLWVSVATHVVVIVAVMLMPRRAQTLDDPTLPIEIVFTAPVPSLPERLPPPNIPKPVARPKPTPAPKPIPREEPKPVVEAPPLPPKPVVPEIAAAPLPKAEPPKPRPVVRTGLLDEVAGGPAIVASKASRSTIVASGFDALGSGTGTGSHAGPGRVADAAFDTQAAAPKGSRTGNVSVKESGFGVEAVAAAKPKGEPRRPLGALDTEVEILSKPKPVYTQEARDLRLEGDVVLEVTFTAGGVLRVLGVSQGLGHGLDEAAIEAAKKIRFNPARRDGAPVDHTAKLRVVFRLA
jgi:TonB family protein